MTIRTHLKVAVLVNGGSANRDAVKASFDKAITTVSVNAQVDFYDPIGAQTYPEPARYDLIVLSGGSVDPMGSEPWVLKMGDFLRTTVAEYPRQKIMGTCWGHQTIHVAFGGVVGQMDKAEIGVTTIPLTPAGSTFFGSSLPSSEQFKIHEFHAREVKTPAEGFIALAEGNQSFISPDNTIITFQGHPEMTAKLAQRLLRNVAPYMGVEDSEKEEIAVKMESPEDGLHIWKRIVEWVAND